MNGFEFVYSHPRLPYRSQIQFSGADVFTFASGARSRASDQGRKESLSLSIRVDPATSVEFSASLQPRVDWLTLESQDAEHALVNPSQRLALNESFQPFDSQCELS